METTSEQKKVDTALAAAMRSAPGKPVATNGKPAEVAGTLTLIDRINEMANRDQEDWRWLTDTLRKFVAQRRADLDYLERLLGTAKPS